MAHKRVKVSVHMEPEMKAFYEDTAKENHISLSKALELVLLEHMFKDQIKANKKGIRLCLEKQ